LLIKDGHLVELFCDSRKGRPLHEQIEGITVHRIKNVSPEMSGIGRLLRLPIFWNPIWVYQFVKFVARGKFEVIHAINLTMAPLGLLAGRLFRLPVIYDMYENYPAAIRSWRLRGIFNRVFRNASAAQMLDRLCVRAVDWLIVVTEESAERAQRLGAREERIAVVHNTANLRELESRKIDDEIQRRYQSNYTVVYTGIVGFDRGLDTVIAAMPKLRETIPTIKLVIAGGGPSEPALRELAGKLGVEDCVDFTGWIDHQLFSSYIQVADVCIVPHPADDFINTTMPNKLFEYMAAAKPVLVSDAKPLARIIHECHCGEVFQTGSVESLITAVLRLHANDQDYGERGRQAVYDKYNWEISSRTLSDLYGKLAVNTRQRDIRK